MSLFQKIIILQHNRVLPSLFPGWLVLHHHLSEEFVTPPMMTHCCFLSMSLFGFLWEYPAEREIRSKFTVCPCLTPSAYSTHYKWVFVVAHESRSWCGESCNFRCVWINFTGDQLKHHRARELFSVERESKSFSRCSATLAHSGILVYVRRGHQLDLSHKPSKCNDYQNQLQCSVFSHFQSLLFTNDSEQHLLCLGNNSLTSSFLEHKEPSSVPTLPAKPHQSRVSFWSPYVLCFHDYRRYLWDVLTCWAGLA